MWASERWGVSLDEQVFGEPEDQRLREQVARLGDRFEQDSSALAKQVKELEDAQNLLIEWALTYPEFSAAVRKRAPGLAERLAG